MPCGLHGADIREPSRRPILLERMPYELHQTAEALNAHALVSFHGFESRTQVRLRWSSGLRQQSPTFVHQLVVLIQSMNAVTESINRSPVRVWSCDPYHGLHVAQSVEQLKLHPTFRCTLVMVLHPTQLPAGVSWSMYYKPLARVRSR